MALLPDVGFNVQLDTADPGDVADRRPGGLPTVKGILKKTTRKTAGKPTKCVRFSDEVKIEAAADVHRRNVFFILNVKRWRDCKKVSTYYICCMLKHLLNMVYLT